ncbi:MAG: hypothetical protein GY811_12435 [Myxococcales bacterium]|nr:hypothetical protein [Myxococcales bacterium]
MSFISLAAVSAHLCSCIPDMGDETQPVSDATPIPDATPADAMPDAQIDLLALGETVYFTAGGAPGCSGCHGMDATGGVGGFIQNKSRAVIVDALDTVSQMGGIELSEIEIDAVTVYLAWLWDE